MRLNEPERHRRIRAVIENIIYRGDPWARSFSGIEADVKYVAACLEALFPLFNEIENKKSRSRAFKSLEELLLALDNIVSSFHNLKLAATKQAYIAQSAKRRKAAKRYSELVECIKAEAEAQRRALSTGIKFAQMMRPGVRRRLGLEPDGDGWPSASTIKAAISILKSAFTGSSGQDLKK